MSSGGLPVYHHSNKRPRFCMELRPFVDHFFCQMRCRNSNLCRIGLSDAPTAKWSSFFNLRPYTVSRENTIPEFLEKKQRMLNSFGEKFPLPTIQCSGSIINAMLLIAVCISCSFVTRFVYCCNVAEKWLNLLDHCPDNYIYGDYSLEAHLEQCFLCQEGGARWTVSVAGQFPFGLTLVYHLS